MYSYRRAKPTNKVRGIQAQDISYNEQTGTVKVLGPVLGMLTHKGRLAAASAQIPVYRGALLALYNLSGNTVFVKTGEAAIGAAPDADDGICLPPHQYTVIVIPYEHSFIRSSSTDVIAYLIEDDSIVAQVTTG